MYCLFSELKSCSNISYLILYTPYLLSQNIAKTIKTHSKNKKNQSTKRAAYYSVIRAVYPTILEGTTWQSSDMSWTPFALHYYKNKSEPNLVGASLHYATSKGPMQAPHDKEAKANHCDYGHCHIIWSSSLSNVQELFYQFTICQWRTTFVSMCLIECLKDRINQA